jgi:hypothetical protein
MIATCVRPQPCRYCGEPTWLSDDEGGLHVCCRYWLGEVGARWCLSCRTASGLKAADARRQVA